MTGKVVTPAQMDTVVKRYKKCEVEHITYDETHTRAVLFHSLKNRTCDPFLFELSEDGKWRLDLKSLGLGLGHTYGNIWYMHYGQQENSGIWKYNFGFNHVYFRRPKGEQFDHQGIPYYRRFGLNINHVYEGALIQKIHEKDSFMAKIGIKEGDIIQEWEGVRFPHNSFIGQRMENVRPGLDIRMVIRRGDKIFSQIVKAPPYPKAGQLRFGATYQSPGPKIPFVHYVEPNSQAEKLGLKTGDYITKWQEITSPSVRYVYKSIKALKENEKITAEVYRNKGNLPLTSFAKPLRTMSKVH